MNIHPRHEIVTLQDVYEDVLLTFDAFSAQTGPTKNIARRAAVDAVRRVQLMHDWSYYKTHGRITTDPLYAQGTISYDHATRRATLTGGSWPENAVYGKLVVAGVHYRIKERLSATILVLYDGENPGADLPAGTAYQWYRSRYSLPDDFRKLESSLYDLSTGWTLNYIRPDAWIEAQFLRREPSVPQEYTFLPSQTTLGRMEMELTPAPSVRREYEFVYLRQPEPIRILSGGTHYDVGRVTVSGVGVAGTGTAWTNEMVGAVIRFSGSVAAATGIGGGNPFVEQRIVTAVSDAANLTIDSAASLTHVGVGYTISSAIDAPHYMIPLIQRMADLEYAGRRGRSGDQLTMYTLAMRNAYVEAANADRLYGEAMSGTARSDRPVAAVAELNLE